MFHQFVVGGGVSVVCVFILCIDLYVNAAVL